MKDLGWIVELGNKKMDTKKKKGRNEPRDRKHIIINIKQF